MDDDSHSTARVVLELRAKLAELDGKAAAFQRDLRAEFGRFMDDRLKLLPAQQAAEIARIIDESMATSCYPSLNPPSPNVSLRSGGSGGGGVGGGSHQRSGSGGSGGSGGSSGFASPSPAPSPTCDRTTSWEGRVKSPPPILYHTSGTPKMTPKREREGEFHGLFTPNFLPLLESRDHAMQSPPISPLPMTPTFGPALAAAEATVAADAAAAANAAAANAAANATNATASGAPAPAPASTAAEKLKQQSDGSNITPTTPDSRPVPIRHLTERSSSADSSASDATKVRRSALRRSSSSNRGSPRRVRFEFQGVEVLPSSSPQASTIPTPSAAEENAAVVTVTAAQPVADASALLKDDDSSAGTTPSLLGIDCDEDLLPKPKKVSSTQALRALSRNPLDAGTQWTVVNPDSEELQPQAMANVGSRTLRVTPEADVSTRPTASSSSSSSSAKPSEKAQPLDTIPRNSQKKELYASPDGKMNQDDEEVSDDDEFLSIRSKAVKKSISPATQSPLSRSPRQNNPNSRDMPLPAETSSGLRDAKKVASPAPNLAEDAEEQFGDDADELFDFEEEEDEGGVARSSTKSKSSLQHPKKYIADDDGDEDIDDLDEVKPSRKELTATSEPKPVSELPASAPTPSASLFTPSLGSYKGTPITLPPIKNPRLYDEIAGMKDVHFFVGSVDGRSGVEAADMGSYRATIGAALPSTPRSLGERLALEEAMSGGKTAEK